MKVSSGSATWARCLPSAPGCLPGLRPSARRAARLGFSPLPFFVKRPDDGGSEVVDQLRLRCIGDRQLVELAC